LDAHSLERKGIFVATCKFNHTQKATCNQRSNIAKGVDGAAKVTTVMYERISATSGEENG
jgi:hypothetical protein